MRISEWSSDVCSSDLKYINYKIPPPEYLVHDDFEIMSLIVINRHPNTAVLGEQFAKQLQPRPYHGQLLAMLQIIVIMLKGRPRIIRSEEHSSELQSLMRTSYAVFCLTKKQY